MPKTPSKTPEVLRPYVFHGIDLDIPESGKEAVGVCPFCGEKKFNVNKKTGLYRCWKGSCGVEGNSYTFLKEYWKFCLKCTTKDQYQKLADQSGFLFANSAKKFGCVFSDLKNNWLVPGFNVDSQLTGLYRFCKIKEKEEWVPHLLPTPGAGHHLFNLQNYDSSKMIVDLCEGWRDGIAWAETLEYCENDDGTPMSEYRNVLCVPGTNSFKEQWCKFFAGKVVNILYDNDWPRVNSKTGNIMEPAGLKGVKRVSSILMSSSTPPLEVHFLRWDGSATGYSEDLKDGTDLRDFIRGI